MDTEKQKLLIKKFPNLYADSDASIYETCMCWGFDVGNGWYDLIYKLSEDLENLIVEWKVKNRKNDIYCASCGCNKKNHFRFYGKCLSIHKVPTKEIKYKYLKIKLKQSLLKTKIINLINKLNFKIIDFINIILLYFYFEYKACFCNKYKSSFPRASQVKEKFGTLRFYMTSSTDEMDNLIDQAEKDSETICEVCGKPGKLRNGGWMVTLCDNCNNKKEEKNV